MRILLLGEYSNLHNTLADGLRCLGHTVMLVSNGDFWKNYPRDIDVSRRYGRWGALSFALRLATVLPRLRGFDVVQIINPLFLELTAEHIAPVYRYLRRHNGAVVMGAFGMDYYWVRECRERMPLRYSDFNIGNKLRTDAEAVRYADDWLGTSKETLCRMVAHDCDAIVSCLYEYHACYAPLFPHKEQYIPLPVKCHTTAEEVLLRRKDDPFRLFIGVNKERSCYKGTDIMLAAAQRVERECPERFRVTVAENVPYNEYIRLMKDCDAIADQLYSYTPAMNALQAMEQGIMAVGGGESEHYALLEEQHLRPIINVSPSFQSCYETFHRLADMGAERSNTLRMDSRRYVWRHHNHLDVARRYECLYKSLVPCF